MTGPGDGKILACWDGSVQILTASGRYWICPEYLGMLFFGGEPALIYSCRDSGENPLENAGEAELTPSGRAIALIIDDTLYLVPRDRFLAVALGEEISCILHESPDNGAVTEIPPPRPGGDGP